jgi:hypothetical protein
LSSADAFLDRELQKAAHRFITRLQHDGESPLAMRLVKQFGLHGRSLELSSAVALEVLHGALVFLRLGTRRERAKISTAARFGVDLAGIKPILA